MADSDNPKWKWQEMFDWVASHDSQLRAIPHAHRFGSTSKRVEGQEVAGIYVGVDSFSSKVRQDVRRAVQELFGSEVWVDVHFARKLRGRGERSLG
jgi:hypothetical protein